MLKRHSEVPIKGTSMTLKGALSQRNSFPLILPIERKKVLSPDPVRVPGLGLKSGAVLEKSSPNRVAYPKSESEVAADFLL